MAFVDTELLMVNYFGGQESGKWVEMEQLLSYKNKVEKKFKERYPGENISFNLYDVVVRKVVNKNLDYFELVRVIRDRVFLKKRFNEKDLDWFNSRAEERLVKILKESLE